MSASVMRFPSTVVWCANGCGQAVSGQIFCADCYFLSRELAQDRLFSGMPRADVGLMPHEVEPAPAPMSRSCRVVLVIGFMGSAAITVGMVAGAIHLGLLAIRWLCLHSL